MKHLALSAIGLGCLGTAAYSQTVPVPDEGPAVYVVRVISVGSTVRDAFVACLAQNDLPFWRELKGAGLLARVSVFEVISVASSEPGTPGWNFVISSQLAEGANADSFLQAVEKRKGCESAAGVEVRRMETLRTTPNSNYARTTAADDLKARESKVEFSIEYIAVKATPETLGRYRETMRLDHGPAAGVMIRDGWMFSAVALEKVKVNYNQPGMPNWNQIHFVGVLPGKDRMAVRDAADAALRQVNPGNGGYEGVTGSVASIRTMPRVDLARELFELAVR